MIRVNLLPRTARAAAGPDRQTVIAGLIGVLVLAGMLFHWWSLSSQSRSLQSQITSMQAEIKQLEAVAQKVEQFKADKKQLEERLNVIRTLLASQTVPVHLLQALNDELPDEIWINSVSKIGTKLVIRGYSFTDFGIANFMTRLGQTAPLFQEVELVVSEQTEVQKVPLKKFEVMCRVAG